MSGTSPKKKSQRQIQVGETIKRSLAQILAQQKIIAQELALDPITITEVSMSPDLRYAKVFFIPLGGKNCSKNLATLTKYTPFLQKQLAKTITWKFVPKLLFQQDQTFAEVARIEELLNNPRVKRDLQ